MVHFLENGWVGYNGNGIFVIRGSTNLCLVCVGVVSVSPVVEVLFLAIVGTPPVA